MPSRATRRRPLGPPPARFGVQHIPQRPPPLWLRDYFADLKQRLLEHAVVIRLARIASVSTSINAAAQLGIPRYAAVNAMNVVHSTLTRSGRHATFDDGLHALAAHLDHDAELVDYGRRRAALSTWQISTEQWNELIDGLPQQLVKNRRVPHTHWGDGKRRLASTWVWTEITHGDHIYAPAVRPDLQAPRLGGSDNEYVHTRWRHLNHSTPSGHYRQLRQRLDALARRLSIEINTVDHD